MRLALVLLVAACGGRSNQPTATVVVSAGDQPGAGVAVISHRADGSLLDEELADAVGDARVAVEPGALVTAVFPADLTDPAAIALVTTPAPAAGGEVDLTGPAAAAAPVTAGALEIQPVQPLAADRFEIRLGCATIEEPSLPVVVDVASSCFGSDANLDVLVLGYTGTQLAGYAAGRVAIADGVAIFAPATWQTARPAVPVTLDGVQPTVSWVLYADGLPLWTDTLTDQGLGWTGLTVDRVAITATLGDATASQVALRRTAGLPTSIALGAADFLPPIAPSLAQHDPQALALHWAATDVGADATDLHVAWQTAGRAVTWDAVLPPDATSIQFPAIDDPAIDGLIAPPDGAVTVRLRELDTNALAGFDALVGAGIDLSNPSAPTIAPLPAGGEIRTTEAAPASGA